MENLRTWRRLLMNYYLVLLNRDKVVSVLYFDNEDAQLSQIKILSELPLSYRNPYYDHVQKCNEVS